MAFTLATALAAIGTAVSVAGTVVGMSQSTQQNKLQKKAREMEANKNNLEAARQKREIYRRTIAAQAASEASAASQGGLYGSGLQGGLAQAQNQGMQGVRDTNQNLQFSQAMGQVQQKMQQPNWGGFMQSIGSGLSDIGSFFSQNRESLNR